MDILIRRCEIVDLKAICKLNKFEMGYDYPEENTAEKLQKLLASRSDAIFVALVDGEVAGYVHANDYDVLYAPHIKNIMGIAVSGRFRKKGIGRALLDEVENWARETGASCVRLVSGSTRIGAHEFYRRCGYHQDKLQLNFKKLL